MTPAKKPTAKPAYDPWAAPRLDRMRDKLRGVGATEGEVEEFSAEWLDPAADHADKVVLYALGDAQMRAMLLQWRAAAEAGE